MCFEYKNNQRDLLTCSCLVFAILDNIYYEVKHKIVALLQLRSYLNFTILKLFEFAKSCTIAYKITKNQHIFALFS